MEKLTPTRALIVELVRRYSVELRDSIDPETGERYTVKRCASTRILDGEGGWRHVEVILEATSPEFEPIVIAADGDADVAVVAEFLGVLGETIAEDRLE